MQPVLVPQPEAEFYPSPAPAALPRMLAVLPPARKMLRPKPWVLKQISSLCRRCLSREGSSEGCAGLWSRRRGNVSVPVPGKVAFVPAALSRRSCGGRGPGFGNAGIGSGSFVMFVWRSSFQAPGRGGGASDAAFRGAPRRPSPPDVPVSPWQGCLAPAFPFARPRRSRPGSC